MSEVGLKMDNYLVLHLRQHENRVADRHQYWATNYASTKHQDLPHGTARRR